MRMCLIVVLVSTFCLSAKAAIIGMLSEDEQAKLELVQVSEESVRIAIVSAYDLPEIYLSRFLGGEGGNVSDLFSALSQGKLPAPETVADRMAEDVGRRYVKIGVFTSKEKHSFVSLFTGQRVELPISTAPRISEVALENGFKRQIFEFAASSVAAAEDLAALVHGEVDLALVTQVRAGFETEMRKSLELNLSKISAPQCADLVK